MVDTGRVPVIDLNADVAEGETLAVGDRAVLDSVTSASLACGFHAGSRPVMRATAGACVDRGIVIGAHVSFRDREGFGRRTVEVGHAQLVADILEQCAVLAEEVGAVGGTVAFVKPHGALYNLMGTDAAVAGAVAEALGSQASRVLVAQAGTPVVGLAQRAGVRSVAEAFPDRGYRADGSLVPRSGPGALIDEPAAIAARAVSLALGYGVEAIDGTWTPVVAETLCIHGDAPDAGVTARAVRAALESAGIEVVPFLPPVSSPGRTSG